ncbi:hypothetical protein NP233_g790 [Leucocoprinus birnbaumii]|uniref:ATP11-domain-containing protein n=1 Tax=Leucocoprinus birnbaumii TaxID=56174 RepID=A0AAD5W3M8_9AGAR|nr:hypothetical protein NP233_g790 [Leucocoprinus birnbaumii]
MISRISCVSRPIAARAVFSPSQRCFHGSPVSQDTVGEKVRELGHKVNMKVGQGLASAIDKGEQVTNATKERLDTAESGAEEGKEFVEEKAGDQWLNGTTKALNLAAYRRYSIKVDYESKYAGRIQQLASELIQWQLRDMISYRKGVSVGKLKEEAKLHQQEEARRRREEREAALAAQKQQQEPSVDDPASPNMNAGTRKDSSPVKPLTSILNTSRVLSTPHTPEQIGQLWNAYHMSRSGGTGRGFLCASIPLDLYKKMSTVAEKYPTFIVPIRRPKDSTITPVEGESDSAYEFYLLQWDFHEAPRAPSADDDPFVKPSSSESPNPRISTILFTPLEEYKLRATFATPYLVLTNYTDLASTHGLVLLRGEVTPRSGASGNYMLSQEDAQQLSMAIQKFYLWGNGEGEEERLLRTFHERPGEFKWEDLIRAADWRI